MVTLFPMNQPYSTTKLSRLNAEQAELTRWGHHQRLHENAVSRSRWLPSIVAVLVLVCVPCPASSMELSGMLAIDAVSMTGKNTNRTTFEGGASTLQWPIDVKTPSIRAGLAWRDIMEVHLGIIAEPWGSNNGRMEDMDYLDEARFPGRQPHPGVDIYSETALDSKVLIVSVSTSVLPLRTRYLSAGLTAGYRYEEYDYRGYNTRQTGYGSWQDQSSWVNGPSAFYTVEYDICSVGVALQGHVDDTIVLTFEASSLPLVHGSDEDEHLRRNRVTFTSTTGSGYQTSLRGLFRITQRWTIGSECTYTRIAADGDQDQFWYGDDPATPGFDDTGYSLSGIDAEQAQKNFRFTIGSSCSF